jgi:phosphoserine phosphatase RsbU/P
VAVNHADVHDHWENAPSGHLITSSDGRILRANSTILQWLGYLEEEIRCKSIRDLLTSGGRIHYDTHFAPLLHLSGELTGVAVDLVTADGTRLPVFLAANVATDSDGRPALLRISLLDAADRRAYERELVDQRHAVESAHGPLREFAETMRRSLLPPALSQPPGLQVADYYHAASVDDIGGDFYDLFPLSATRWGFFLGDVAGKGVDAAIVTGLTRYALHSAALAYDDPVQVLSNLNSVLKQKFGPSAIRLCTLIYGNLIRTTTGFDVELASGGHLPPLLLGHDGNAYYADIIGGQAVGMTAHPKFVANRLRLAPGDTLVLYTDGLTEASIGIGAERFDDNGALLRFGKSLAPASPAGIVDAIHRLLDGLGNGVRDDVALLAIGVPGIHDVDRAQA